MTDRFHPSASSDSMTASFLDAPAPAKPIPVDVETCQELLETQRRLAMLIAREELDLLLGGDVPVAEAS